MTRIHRFADLETLSRAAARALVEDIQSRLAVQDRYTLALAGGSTPQRLYERLGAEAAGPLPWERLHLFWGDERYVPPTDPRSNHRLVQRTLLADAPCPAANVHPIPTDRTPPETAAAAYEQTLRRFFADRGATFDTVLLGLGADAHTASLFPETPALGQTDDWVRVVEAPPRHDVSTRISCTLPVLNGARQAIFLAAGPRKRAAVHRVLNERDESLPATHVQPRSQLDWYLDRACWPPKHD
jgi:6-phosphogluconolactonase